MSCGCSKFLRDYAPVKYTVGGKQEEHLIQANLSKWHSLALSTPNDLDGHILDCLPLLFQAQECIQLLNPTSQPQLIEPGTDLQPWECGTRTDSQSSLSGTGQDMLSSCGHSSESGLGNRHYYLQVREDTGVEYRGLVSIDRGGGLPGLPTDQP